MQVRRLTDDFVVAAVIAQAERRLHPPRSAAVPVRMGGQSHVYGIQAS
jgi:hypothetical protein